MIIEVRTFVWVSAWEQQCCGEHFRVGSSVVWNVIADDVDDWLLTLVSSEWGGKVRYRESHHGPYETPSGEMRGVVRSIRELTSDVQPDYQPGRYPHERMMVPVPGSGRLREVEIADPWDSEPADDASHQSFDGWVVELETGHPR